MAKLFVFLYFIFYSGIVLCQIGGISNSKCLAPSGSTVEKGSFEFEPSLSINHFSNVFDGAGKINYIHGDSTTSGFFFRITLGIADNVELGTSFSTTLEDIFIGIKYNLLKEEKTSIALLGGASFPAGTKFVPDTLNDIYAQHTLSGGVVLSRMVSAKVSIDIYLTYSRILRDFEPDNLFCYGAAAGWYVTDKFQAVLEADCYSAFRSGPDEYKISIVPGFTYSYSPSLLLIVGAQSDILGMNASRGASYFAAFTMTIK